MIKTKWKNPRAFSHYLLSPSFTKWLLFSGSLTKKLQSLNCGSLKIQVLKERLEIGQTNEIEKLNLTSNAYVYCREVYITCNEKIWVYARSAISPGASGLYKHKFRTLGEKPLGGLLFHSLNAKRSDFELAKICPYDSQYAEPLKPFRSLEEIIWGRRSCFISSRDSLVLTEVFSPHLIAIIT